MTNSIVCEGLPDNSDDLKFKRILVSCFKSVTDKAPVNCSIFNILNQIKSEDLKFKIEKIRLTLDKSEKELLKKQLPCVTVSGVFKNGHAAKDLKEHSGLMQIDFDAVLNLKDLKEKICADIYTYACFISPSGTGLKAIVKIIPEFHLESFEALTTYYAVKYNATMDAKCKDVGRLMYLSYDENLFVNKNAMVFDTIKNDVEQVVSQIENAQTDVTVNYDNWLKIGFAFAKQFGEAGRDYFHRVSCINVKYVSDACNKQYDNCLKSSGDGVTIKTFFHLAKKAGLTVSNSKQSVKSNVNQNVNSSGTQNVKQIVNSGLPIATNTTDKPINETSKIYIVEEYLKQQYDLRYNEITVEIECKNEEENIFEPINENRIYIDLKRNCINISQSDLAALLRAGRLPVFNPFKDYFTNLPKWNGTTDHIAKLCTYVTAKDQNRFNTQLKKMLVRCIACAYGIAFNKHAFILMGGQSGGKTTLCRWLCPDALKDYYTENLSADNKDNLTSLCQNFIINLDELAALSKMDLNGLKSMLSRDYVKVRLPYDRKTTVHKRRANFFGSTNKDEFLNDETGSVRWLCHEILKINWDYKKDLDINLIWAQALSLFKSDFKYELTAKEIEENENANAQHQLRSPELEYLTAHFVPAAKGDLLSEAMTATSIINRLREANLTSMNLNVTNMGKALRMAGYTQTTERMGENKVPTKIYFLRFYPTTLTINV
jgi:predicted P-loop ATPase